MKLEEEIKQKQFKSEKHKLAVNIIYTHGWLVNSQSEHFRKEELTIPQYNILRILRGQHPDPININLLKERMLDKMSDVSRLVERLRAKGLVERRICENDRRRAEVVITEKGLEVLEKLDAVEHEFEKILNNLNDEEAKTLNDLMDKLRG